MTETPYRKRPSRYSALSLAMRPLNLRLDSSTQQDMRIEIVPLIDVIFCILVFFLLAAVGFSRQRAISLDLPKASTGVPQMREMVIVSLDYAGQAYVEQQPVGENQLYQAVDSYFQRRPNALMVLYASKDVRYDRVMQVLDILRQVGGDRVALATLPEGAQQPTLTNPSAPFPGTVDPNAFPTYPNNNSLDSFGAPPIPGNSPTLPGLPGQDSAQPGIQGVPPTDQAPASPALPAVPPSDSGAATSEQ